MNPFLDETPLEHDIALHKAHLFDRHLVRFWTLMNVDQTTEVSTTKLVNDIKIKDLVTSRYILWPEC